MHTHIHAPTHTPVCGHIHIMYTHTCTRSPSAPHPLPQNTHTTFIHNKSHEAFDYCADPTRKSSTLLRRTNQVIDQQRTTPTSPPVTFDTTFLCLKSVVPGAECSASHPSTHLPVYIDDRKQHKQQQERLGCKHRIRSPGDRHGSHGSGKPRPSQRGRLLHEGPQLPGLFHSRQPGRHVPLGRGKLCLLALSLLRRGGR